MKSIKKVTLILLISLVFSSSSFAAINSGIAKDLFKGTSDAAKSVNKVVSKIQNKILNPIQKGIDKVNNTAQAVEMIDDVFNGRGIADSVKDFYGNGTLGGFMGSTQGGGMKNGKCTGFFCLDSPEEFGVLGASIGIKAFIHKVLNFFLGFVGIIGTGMFIYAGFRYLTSFGEDAATDNAKATMKHVIIGILIILASFAIVWTLINFAGGGDTRSGGSQINKLQPLREK